MGGNAERRDDAGCYVRSKHIVVIATPFVIVQEMPLAVVPGAAYGIVSDRCIGDNDVAELSFAVVSDCSDLRCFVCNN